MPENYDINVIATDEPYLVLTSFLMIDDNNQNPDYNEDATLSISIANIGLATGENISAVIAGFQTQKLNANFKEFLVGLLL